MKALPDPIAGRSTNRRSRRRQSEHQLRMSFSVSSNAKAAFITIAKLQ
jgi:hypothetical protein